MKNTANNTGFPLSWKTIAKTLQLLSVIVLCSLFFYSCSKKEEGCTDEKATNFNPKAVEDDGSCTYCSEPTNPQCPNYDPCYGATPVTAQFDVSERLGAASFQNIFIKTINVKPGKEKTSLPNHFQIKKINKQINTIFNPKVIIQFH